MDQRSYSDLSTQAWNDELERHRNRHRVPERLTEEQAQAQARALVRMALIAVARGYGNYFVRQRGFKGVPPNVRTPRLVQEGIDTQVTHLDDYAGHAISNTYQTIANSLLSVLRAAEDEFVRHND